MLAGIASAVLAGLMWGLIFITPWLVPDYPAVMLSAGRYLAFGLICLPLGWLARPQLRALRRQDWWVATRLTLVGNLLYYLCLAAAIRRTGSPITTMIIGTLPVVMAVAAQWQYRRQGQQLAWRRLLPGLLLIAAGLLAVNYQELQDTALAADPWRFGSGLLLAVLALFSWTWYPLRNARWLHEHPQHSASTWATAQGLVTLPLAALAYVLACVGLAWQNPDFPLPAGPQPDHYLPLMLIIGLLCSWLGTHCWNYASQHLPATLLGPLVVAETLAGLLYSFILRQRWPPLSTALGIGLLVLGVLYALQTQRRLLVPAKRQNAH